MGNLLEKLEFMDTELISVLGRLMGVKATLERLTEVCVDDVINAQLVLNELRGALGFSPQAGGGEGRPGAAATLQTIPVEPGSPTPTPVNFQAGSGCGHDWYYDGDTNGVATYHCTICGRVWAQRPAPGAADPLQTIPVKTGSPTPQAGGGEGRPGFGCVND
jgi:hypothetical protein